MRPLLALLLLLLAAPPAVAQDERNTVTRLIEWATGGQVRLVGLEGWLPGAPRAERIEVLDAQGPWLVLEDVTAQWSSLALLRGRAQVGTLSAARATLLRRPAPGGGGGGGDLPLQVSIDELRVGRLELQPAATGLDRPVVLALTGALDLAALDQGTARLTAQGVDTPTRLHAEARLAPATLDIRATVEEPAGGLVATLANLPDLGALAATATLQGPRAAPEIRLDLRAGQLQATAAGTLGSERLALDITARAPAMAPGPALSWQSIAIEAHVAGPPTAPEARGQAVIEGLVAGDTRLARLAADLTGNAGRVRLAGRGEGLVLPAPLGDALRAAPLEIAAEAALQDEGRPVELRLAHPLLALSGTIRTAGVPQATLTLDLPDLDPLSAEIAGTARLRLDLRLPDDGADIDAEGTIVLDRAPVPALSGARTRFALAGTRRGERTVLQRLEVDSPALRLAGQGSWDEAAVSATLDATLPDLALALPALRGNLRLALRLDGRPDDFAVTLAGSGAAGTQGFPPLPVTLEGRVANLPAAPQGTLSAAATLEGAPLALEASGSRAADGTLRLELPAASWKSLQASASLLLPPGATMPAGTAALAIARLEDLRAFAPGLPAGRLKADLRRAPGGALAARLEGAAAPFSRFALTAEGPPEAIALTLAAGGPADIAAAGRLDLPAQTLLLTALRATRQGQAATLQAPVRLDFGDTVRIDRLRLALAGGTLEASGRLSPTLDLTATLAGLPAAVALPGLEGRLRAEARLGGTPAAPTGTLRLAASGLRLPDGPAAALPPASLAATATLAGASAQLDATATAGPARLAANGRVPLGAGALDLRLSGRAPLALLDPILTARGRRAQGDLTLQARLGGTLASPAPTGTLRLARGELRDDTIGLRLHDLAGTVRAQDGRATIALAGRAGAGTLALDGTATLAAAPALDLRLRARNARPVVSDLLTAQLDADLALRGRLGQDLLASGRIGIDRAEIRIPERMPARLPVLEVRVRGATPPPPPAPPPPVALALVVEAPGNVFVRGRGLEAELAGRVAIGGTLAEPRPQGALTLRRGSFNLLGTTLTLTEGRVGMDPAQPLDPAIDFAATARTGTTSATVRLTGHASTPEIRLTSEPELPQDEILAQLLLGRSVSQLNALQLAQIAAGLAELSGQGGLDPLGRLRGGLGLDRLAIGSTEGGNATLEAGRNLAPGVYLGVRQGTGNAGTRAVVQIDIGRGLKLQGEVGTSTGTPDATGTGESGSSLGVVWSREW